ncbi:unnamed protein product, partial [Arabidopsis halleri]
MENHTEKTLKAEQDETNKIIKVVHAFDLNELPMEYAFDLNKLPMEDDLEVNKEIKIEPEVNPKSVHDFEEKIPNNEEEEPHHANEIEDSSWLYQI